NRVGASEEFLCKHLVDDRDGRHRWRIHRLDSAARYDSSSNGIEILRVRFYPGRPFIQVWLALDLYACTPIIVFHGCVYAEADVYDTGQGVEALFHSSIERFQLRVGVSRGLRIDVDDVPVASVKLQVGVLQFV